MKSLSCIVAYRMFDKNTKKSFVLFIDIIYQS